MKLNDMANLLIFDVQGLFLVKKKKNFWKHFEMGR